MAGDDQYCHADMPDRQGDVSNVDNGGLTKSRFVLKARLKALLKQPHLVDHVMKV